MTQIHESDVEINTKVFQKTVKNLRKLIGNKCYGFVTLNIPNSSRCLMTRAAGIIYNFINQNYEQIRHSDYKFGYLEL